MRTRRWSAVPVSSTAQTNVGRFARTDEQLRSANRKHARNGGVTSQDKRDSIPKCTQPPSIELKGLLSTRLLAMPMGVADFNSVGESHAYNSTRELAAGPRR